MKLPHVTAPNNVLQALFNLIVQLWSRFFSDRMDPVPVPADLAGLRVEAGTRKWVSALRCNFIYDPASTLVADDITVVASTNAGRWVREQPAPDAWGRQVSFYVNPTPGAGSDLATGIDEAHAIASMAEWARRTDNGAFMSVASDLFILASLPQSDPFPPIKPRVASAQIRMQGVAQELATGEITAVVPRNPAGNAQPLARITSAGFDWAPYVNSLLYISEINGWCRVVEDVGGGSALITEVLLQVEGDPWTVVTRLPLQGHHFSVRQEVSVGMAAPSGDAYTAVIEIASAEAAVSISGLRFEVSGLQSFITLDTRSNMVLIARCAFDDQLVVYGAVKLINTLTEKGINCDSKVVAHAHLAIDGGAVGHVSYFYIGQGGFVCVGAGLVIYEGHSWCYGGFVAHNVTGIGLAVRGGAILEFSSGFNAASVSGHATTYGLFVSPGARVGRANQATLVIQGDTGDLQVGGSDTLLPNLIGSHGAVLPAALNCTSWANFAANFGGGAFNHNNGAYVGP